MQHSEAQFYFRQMHHISVIVLQYLKWIKNFFTLFGRFVKLFLVVMKSSTINQGKIAQTTNVLFHIFRLTVSVLRVTSTHYAVNRSNWTLTVIYFRSLFLSQYFTVSGIVVS